MIQPVSFELGKHLKQRVKSLPLFFALRGWVGSQIAETHPFLGAYCARQSCKDDTKN
jgi:hypothetical protein